MTPVYRHQVTACVRNDGAIGPYQSRQFDLMLGKDTPERMKKEARRIIKQIGYQAHSIIVQERQ